MAAVAEAENRPDYVTALTLAYYAGMRIEECFTMHGLRHSYAGNTYRNFTEQGYSHEQSCQKVSALLGHNRADVTRCYLASALKGR